MTQDELKKYAADANGRLDHLKKYLKVEDKIESKERIEKLMLAPDFWDDREKAQQIMEELSAAKNIINEFDKLVKDIEDFDVFIELALEEEDDELLSEAVSLCEKISKDLDKTELLSFLSR